MNGLDPDLLGRALASLRGQVKAAFTPPPGGDPGAGGPPPGPPPGGDPGAGGPPPGPPMDPSMGGAPPMDPSMAGGAPPPPPMPPPGGDGIAGQVAQGVQQALSQSGLQGQPVNNNGKPAVKPDINTIATDVFQLKKMLFAMMRHAGIELPPDVLDGPNRDPATGAPAASPTGGSDVAPGSSNGPNGPMSSAISPIQPIQPAMPGPKTASYEDYESTLGTVSQAPATVDRVLSRAKAAAMLLARRKNG
jgi:hypothetical protein